MGARRGVGGVAVGLMVALGLTACTGFIPPLPLPPLPTPSPTAAPDLASVLPTASEMAGWARDGSPRRVILLDPSCEGEQFGAAPADDQAMDNVYYFEGTDASLDIAVRWCPAAADVAFDAMRQVFSLRDPESAEAPQGRMVGTYGDDEFGAQWTEPNSSYKSGKAFYTQFFVTCGHLYFEAYAIGHVTTVPEQTLETLLSPSIHRAEGLGGCGG